MSALGSRPDSISVGHSRHTAIASHTFRIGSLTLLDAPIQPCECGGAVGGAAAAGFEPLVFFFPEQGDRDAHRVGGFDQFPVFRYGVFSPPRMVSAGSTAVSLP